MLALIGGTLIDGRGGAPVERNVTLIDGGRIVAVGDSTLPIPPQARRIAAEGKYVIPGLMDANVHLIFDLWAPTLIGYEGRYDELIIEAAQLALTSDLQRTLEGTL